MQRYQSLVYTVCLQFVHDPDTAQDLTQETFLSAYAAIDRCDPAYHRQWLIKVAANKCRDHLRSGWVRRVEAPGDEAMPQQHMGVLHPPNPPNPEDTAVAQQSEAELRQLIETLREPYGSVLRLYLLEETPVREIARRLGRPETTVQNQLFRGKALLRKQITERRRLE